MAWTLSFEEQFYLLWPFILLVALRRRRLSGLATAAVVLSALAEFLRCVLPLSPEAALWRLYMGPDTRMDGLLIGCLLALALAQRPIGVGERWAAPLGTGAITVIAVTYAVCGLGWRTTYTVGIIAAELAAAALILSVTATRDSWVARVLAVGRWPMSAGSPMGCTCGTSPFSTPCMYGMAWHRFRDSWSGWPSPLLSPRRVTAGWSGPFSDE